MAENAMVKEQLTDAMIEGGAELTAKLDDIGFPLTAAFWLFDPEINEWRLMFASPEVNTRGSIKAYERIQDAIDELGDRAAAVPLSVVGVLQADAELVRSLKLAVPTGPEVKRIRFTKNVIKGRYIHDALIYRAS